MATVAAAKKRRGELQEYEAGSGEMPPRRGAKKQQRNAGQKEATSLPESGTAKDAAVAKNANKAKDQTKDKKCWTKTTECDSDAGEGIGMAWERWRKRRLRLPRRRWPGRRAVRRLRAERTHPGIFRRGGRRRRRNAQVVCLPVLFLPPPACVGCRCFVRG